MMRDGLIKAIRCVHIYKGLRDWEFCEVFPWYYAHPRVL